MSKVLDDHNHEQLRIGVNANADDVTVMLRNITIYYEPSLQKDKKIPGKIFSGIA